VLAWLIFQSSATGYRAALNQMVTVAVQLPGRLRSLPFFLSAWIVSYLAPHLSAAVVDPVVQIALKIASPDASEVGSRIVWVGLLPALYAWAQWLLMRRCLSTAVPWALAVLVGTFLAAIGRMLIGYLDPRLLFDSYLFYEIFWILVALFGFTFVTIAVAVLPIGLFLGVATSLPEAIALPGSGRMRLVWIAVMIPTEYVSTILGEGLYRVMPISDTVTAVGLGGEIAINIAPRICAGLLTAVVSGLLMHAILRRRATKGGDHLYSRFD